MSLTLIPLRHLLLLVLLWCGGRVVTAVEVGVARVDVTPSEPVRLTGYASRKAPHVGVEQKLWAKALAIGSDAEGRAVLLTLDNCGIAEETWREVRRRLEKSASLRPDRLVIASSHTHSGPATTHWAPNIFVRDLTAEEQGAIDRYTVDLIGKLESVALSALRNRKPGRLSWSQGTATFAANRRTRGGPVDQSLPVLRAEGMDGKLLALVGNYACHCTTLGGEFNRACGDWAGYAQEAIEREAPGAVALITIGCGADANPSPRGGADGGLAFAKQHGEEVGAEVRRLLGQNFIPLTQRLSTRAREIALPFGAPFSRDQWLSRSTNSGIVGYHAKKWLARLDRGEKVPASLYYPITTWNFGDELALVFLPGEVVVDYALRLKRELDGQRLWVTAYANYVPCYIPSRRILAEGGYEAEDSLWYYDRPSRLSTNVEDRIVSAVAGLVPGSFKADPRKAERPDPRSAQEALRAFRLAADLDIELVAAEPLVTSPVAVDWDARGRLWVCEMYDYPSGLNPPPDVNRPYGQPLKEPPGGFRPGGRIRVLSDTDGDGRYDKSTLFLDRIPFPTGVMPWRNGALVCAAPDLLYAEDKDGDGRAEVVRTNITGFATHNFQARVNGFSWGLDGWLHASSGLFGGKVRNLRTGREVDLSGRDFRYRPDTGELEPVSGISQMGRVRDDFDCWFGNDNSTLLWHYPLADHYLRRNPHVVYPEPRVSVARGAGANKVFPISRTLTRFNDPQMANIVTSACGPGIYRDTLLGLGREGNAYICEPVHNLVRRLVSEPDGVTFEGRRAPGEERSEFLASSDNWFRPVQVRTGPDGALYVVDMYRFVIEHPRWIPPERLKELDIRAGADKGRIYRVFPRGTKLRPVRDLRALGDEELARALETPNGTTRDLVHQELVARRLSPEERYERKKATSGASALARERGVAQEGAMRVLRQLLTNAALPAVRAQALCLLGDSPEAVSLGLQDRDARVRTLALRLAEPRLRTGPVDAELSSQILACAAHADPRLRLQAALTLGEWAGPESTRRLAELAAIDDRWLRAAILSSSGGRAGPLLEAVIGVGAEGKAGKAAGMGEFIGKLISTAVGNESATDLATALRALVPRSAGAGGGAGGAGEFAAGSALLEPWRMEAIGSLLEALRRRGLDLSSPATTLEGVEPAVTSRIEATLHQAARVAIDADAAAPVREAAIRLLGIWDHERAGEVLGGLLRSPASAQWHNAAVEALSRSRRGATVRRLLGPWNTLVPSVRGRVAEALLARPEWTSGLVESLEQGEVRVSELSAAQWQRLLRVRDRAVRARVEKLQATAPAASRVEVLKKFAGVGSLAGVPENGAAVFDRLCAQCHALRGRGHDVGPNLAEFAGKSVPDYLLAILDPNAGINPNFVAYEVETVDGRSLSGLVRDETAVSLTLVQGGGARESILRKDVVSLRAGGLSLMPEGLEQGLVPQSAQQSAQQEMADLIAWVKGSKPAVFGSATEAQAAAARAEFLRGKPARGLSVTRAVERLPYPGWLGRWPLAYCRQNAGQDRLAWEATAGEVAAGTATFRFPVAMGLHSQPAGGFTLKIDGSAVLSFEVALSDREWSSPDGRVRVRYTVREAHGEDSCGVLGIEIPTPMLKSGSSAEFEAVGSPISSQRWFGLYLADLP